MATISSYLVIIINKLGAGGAYNIIHNKTGAKIIIIRNLMTSET